MNSFVNLTPEGVIIKMAYLLIASGINNVVISQ